MSGHHIRAGLATMTRAAEPAPRDEEPGQQVKWPVGNRISRAVPLMVAAVVAALAAAASGYGYHRDELYFLAAGRHLAWGAQWIAAACAGTAVIVLFTGHTLSTTTFDLLTWTAITWLAIRAIRTGADRLWLVAGVVLGVGLLNKPLPAFLAGGLLPGPVRSCATGTCGPERSSPPRCGRRGWPGRRPTAGRSWRCPGRSPQAGR